MTSEFKLFRYSISAKTGGNFLFWIIVAVTILYLIIVSIVVTIATISDQDVNTQKQKQLKTYQELGIHK